MPPSNRNLANTAVGMTYLGWPFHAMSKKLLEFLLYNPTSQELLMWIKWLLIIKPLLRTGIRKLQLHVFVNKVFLEHSQMRIYVLSMATFML